MAEDKKGKEKAVVVAKKKRSRDEHEWDRALAAADAADLPQRSVRISESEAGEPQDTPQLRRSARTRTTEIAQPTLHPHVGPRTRGGAV